MEKLIPEETQKKIIELWASGLSGGRIALQVNKTRSAVLGFIHRYKAKGDGAGIIAKRPKKMARKIPKKIVSQYEKSLPFKDRRNLRIHELEATSCRFIVNEGGPNACYCGAKIHFRSYCKEHVAVCYITPKTGPK